MAERKTSTTFRLRTDVLELLDRMSQQLGTTNTKIVERSVEFSAALLDQASKSSHADLATLRKRYGDDARIVMGVIGQENDGRPIARLQINGEEPDDVQVVALVDGETNNRVFMFLEVLRLSSAAAKFIELGDEALFVPIARFPVGTLPWPPRPNVAIQIELKDIEQLAEQAEATKDLNET